MKLKSFLKIAVFGILVSCSDENIIFNEYIDVENTQLSFKDTIVFQTKISDTINPHNIFLQLRLPLLFDHSTIQCAESIVYLQGTSLSFFTQKKS